MAESQPQLTPANFRRGMLVDEELMAGITETPPESGTYAAFVLRHTTGEYLGYQAYPSLDAALAALNRIPRAWRYETTSGCGGSSCTKKDGGACDPLACGKKKPREKDASSGTEADSCGTGCSPA